jgi:hypothetical protein
MLTGMNGEQIEQLLPENDADRDLIRQMEREGRIDMSDWLHRTPPVKQTKPRKAKVA